MGVGQGDGWGQGDAWSESGGVLKVDVETRKMLPNAAPCPWERLTV